MKFSHSDLLDPQIVAQICPTHLPVRKGRHDNIANEATEEFVRQWNNIGGHFEGGCLASHGSIMTWGLPECTPERLPVLTRLTELLFVLDDVISSRKLEASFSTRSPESDGFLAKGSAIATSESHRLNTLEKQLYAQMLVELLKIDPRRGALLIEALDQYRGWWGTRRADEIQSWDEWYQYRWEDGA